MSLPVITGSKQSDLIRGLKHLLDLARSGKVVGLGYAVVQMEEDGSFVSGTNAIWTDDVTIRDAVSESIAMLKDRVDAQSKLILQ